MKSVGRHGSVVPPPRMHSTIVMVTSAPVTALYQMCISDGTHGLAPIDAVVCPEARDTSPTTLIRETRGHGSRMVASQSATHRFVIFVVSGVSWSSVYSIQIKHNCIHRYVLIVHWLPGRRLNSGQTHFRREIINRHVFILHLHTPPIPDRDAPDCLRNQCFFFFLLVLPCLNGLSAPVTGRCLPGKEA